MTFKKMTVIVPRLPPAIDGLGDYGLCLAKEMNRLHSIESSFIVGDPSWEKEKFSESFEVKKVSERTVFSLASLLPQEKDAVVLLHYVGYGYARRGSPLWLLKSLEQWKKNHPERKLITMFHELYAFGPIWTSQFWTSPLQRMIVRRLGRLSNSFVTSRTSYAEILAGYTGHSKHSIQVLPVFSNIGEPENTPELSHRKNRMVIFGNKSAKERLYKNSIAQLEKLCLKLGVLEIFDIGPEPKAKVDVVAGKKILFFGALPAEEVSRILKESRFGFINYPTGYLSKSGIFAAYCSHRLLVWASPWDNQLLDSAQKGVHYLSAEEEYSYSRAEDFQKIADNAYHWYSEHSLSKHADLFCKLASDDKIYL